MACAIFFKVCVEPVGFLTFDSEVREFHAQPLLDTSCLLLTICYIIYRLVFLKFLLARLILSSLSDYIAS